MGALTRLSSPRERSGERRVAGVGELLWDLLPGGERLGGAPFNVVAHLRRFSWQASFITAVGDDARGRHAIEAVGRLGVDPSGITVNARPTGVVRVAVDAGGSPAYRIDSPAAYEAIPPEAADAVALPLDLLVFGTLAQQFDGAREATRRLADAAPAAIRLYDVNLRGDEWDAGLVAELLQFATIVKLNDDEQRLLAARLDLPQGPLEAFARAAAGRYGLRAVCVTRGSRGAALLLDDGYDEAPSPAVRVVDTVGAGDAFAAALGHGITAGWAVARILAVATRLGSLVAGREGAIPDWAPAEVLLSNGQQPDEDRGQDAGRDRGRG